MFYSKGKDMYQIMMDKTKVFAANLLLPPENYRNLLSWVHITCLVQEGECWAWNNDWNNYYKTDTTRQEIIKSLDQHFIETCPAVLICHFEQRFGVLAAQQFLKVKTEIEEALEADKLAKRLDGITLKDDEDKVISINTPTTEKSSRNVMGNNNLF